eukprot:TRINITY_DN90199_c0_g1_i1.p2 TRINITY_DN90199_c0_g1~~TRINITY_DN90199_c0_g1_i1.p2  ORF type:complete len:718 (+),score=309.98 TRINITY_DN90199_c0_g1_i1:129-2282(+)
MVRRRALDVAALLAVTASAKQLQWQSASKTPVEQVINLLGQLAESITKDGKQEAAEYDKFACFCKEQADNKQYAIERSEEKIKELTALIEKLETEINELNSEIEELGKDITKLEGEITTETDDRKAEHEKYLAADEEVAGAIKACQEALQVLRDSKKEMKGAKLDLSQLPSTLKKRLSATQLRMLSSVAAAAVGGHSQEPAASKYQSNDIIATLMQLEDDFKAQKKEADETEHGLKSASEKKVLAMSNEKKFKEEDKTEKEAIVGTKTEEKASAEGDKTSEETDKDSDISFREALTEQCQDQAVQWDQRSKARAGELAAIAEATETLKKGAVENYASAKLAGLQKTGKVSLHAAVVSEKGAPSKVTTVAKAATETAKKALNFLQVREASTSERRTAAVSRAVDMLDTASTKLQSSVLAAVAAQASLKSDQFGEVKKLIEDLIKKLEDEAAAEADAKTYCDEELGKALTSRDEQSLSSEEQTTIISEKTAEIAQLTKEVAVLSQEVADINKALNEATELRMEEKAGNEKTLADAKAGKEAVDQAISILTAFYDAQFLQRSKGKVAGPDRDGKTVDDLAPKLSYSDDYKGQQETSKGVIGLLETIASDFESTITTVEEAESTAQSEFETFETDSKDNSKAKEGDIDTKKQDIASAEEAVTAAKDALASAKKLHEVALKELERLQAMCIEGEDSFAERKKQREQEIEALKGAMKILDEWK